MKVQIYRPARTATQSGRRNSRQWCLEYLSSTPKSVEPLMGWTASTDATEQVRMTFPTAEAAVRFAERQGLSYEIVEPQESDPVVRPYADNFRPNQRT